MSASPDYDDQFDAAGQQYNVDPRLLKTVMGMESSGGVNNGKSLPNDPDSPIGPMQLRPSTAKAMGFDDPTDIRQAIKAAAKYLRQGIDATGSADGALSYYYGGPDKTQWGPKTQAYVTKGQSLYPTIQVAAADPELIAGRKLYEANANKAPTPTASASVDPELEAGRKLYEAQKPPDVDPELEAGRRLYEAQKPPPATPTQSTADKYAGWDTFDGPPRDIIAPGLHAALKPDPNLEYGTVLPFAIDKTTGERSFAMPSGLRNALTGAVDLGEGPWTGKVTPEATQLLAMSALGGRPGGTGGALSPFTSVADRSIIPRDMAWKVAASDQRAQDAYGAKLVGKDFLRSPVAQDYVNQPPIEPGASYTPDPTVTMRPLGDTGLHTPVVGETPKPSTSASLNPQFERPYTDVHANQFLLQMEADRAKEAAKASTPHETTPEMREALEQLMDANGQPIYGRSDIHEMSPKEVHAALQKGAKQAAANEAAGETRFVGPDEPPGKMQMWLQNALTRATQHHIGGLVGGMAGGAGGGAFGIPGAILGAGAGYMAGNMLEPAIGAVARGGARGAMYVGGKLVDQTLPYSPGWSGYQTDWRWPSLNPLTDARP